jgi:hypothetical protein
MLAHHTELLTTIIWYKLHCPTKGVWDQEHVTNFLRYGYSTSPFKAFIKHRLFRYTGLLPLLSCCTPIKILVPSIVIMFAHYTELFSAPIWYRLRLPRQSCMRSRSATSGFVLPPLSLVTIYMPSIILPATFFLKAFSMYSEIPLHVDSLKWCPHLKKRNS